MRSTLWTAAMCIVPALAAAATAADAPRPTAAAAAPAAKPPAAAVELVGHRGESKDAPENTLAAYKLAWDRGVPAGELDVHLTKDGKLILSHDANTKRATGGAADVTIKDATVAELKKLDVGSWKGPAFANERMPLLEEVLAAMPKGRRMYLEVKEGPEVIPELSRVTAASGHDAAHLPVISFNYEACRAAKAAMPKHAVYLLSSFKQDKQTKQWAPAIDELIAKTKAAGLDGLDVEAAKAPVVDAAFVKTVKAAGLGMYVWTIDDPARAKELAGFGVDGITTNRPAWMAEQYGLKK